jgi:hypothetical protein
MLRAAFTGAISRVAVRSTLTVARPAAIGKLFYKANNWIKKRDEGGK